MIFRDSAVFDNFTGDGDWNLLIMILKYPQLILPRINSSHLFRAEAAGRLFYVLVMLRYI